MKFSFLFILLGSFLMSQAQSPDVFALEDVRLDKQLQKRTVPVVSGKIIAAKGTDLQKVRVEYALVTLTGQSSKKVGVASDGSFRFNLDLPLHYQQLWLHIGDSFFTGLIVNRDLHVEVDIDKVKKRGYMLSFLGDGVKYTGTDGALNNYLLGYHLYRRDEQEALDRRMHSIPRLDNPSADLLEAAYKGVFDSLKVLQDAYIASHPSPFGWILENERMSDYYSKICISYFNKKMEPELFEKIRSHRTYLLSSRTELFYAYFSYHLLYYTSPENTLDLGVSWRDVAELKDLNAQEKAAIDSLKAAERRPGISDETIQKLTHWSGLLSKRYEEVTQTKIVERGVYILDSIFKSPVADILKMRLNTSYDLSAQKSALERIMQGMRTDWCKAIVQREYETALSKIEDVNKALASAEKVASVGFGEPVMKTAFGASMYKASNMKVTEFLAGLKASFPGKAIVFDLWATWCGPCINQMPHSKDLQLQSKDLPVIFVYACTEGGSGEDQWKRKVAELEQPGIHFFIDDALDAEVREYFSFSGYPGYAIIDRHGVYKKGAIEWLSEIRNKEQLEALIGK